MVCPFIDSDRNPCGEHLKLDTLDYAVAVCANDFTTCPIFWELMTAARNEHHAAAQPAA